MSRVFVTGGAGFVGQATIRRLLARGDEVVAVVRDVRRAGTLGGLEVDLAEGDLSNSTEIESTMAGCDSALHIAGSYRVGIAASERPAMHEANVGTTQRVLDAATTVGLRRTIYVSTVGIFGNTHGRVVDETYRRDIGDGFVSTYDETKYLAHVAAEARIQAGAPIIIVLPGTIYGRDDHSGLGSQLEAVFDGHAAFVALGGTGISPTHVDDVAGGIVAALDRGRVGESYVLAGENMRLREAMAIVAKAGGRRLPRLTIPDVVIRFGARLAPGAGSMFGLSPNLTEIVRASAGVTYWATSAKAAAEFGYRSRDLASGALEAYGPR